MTKETESQIHLIKQKLLGIVPEEKDEKSDNYFRLQNQGFNAAREEMIKNIEHLDLEQLIK